MATEIAKQVDELTELLRAEQIEGSYGVSVTRDGHVLGHGNAVVGLRNTPLGDCSVEGWIDRTEGVKIVKGVLRDADGHDCAEVEGIFILPRWAREQLAQSGQRPPKFE